MSQVNSTSNEVEHQENVAAGLKDCNVKPNPFNAHVNIKLQGTGGTS